MLGPSILKTKRKIQIVPINDIVVKSILDVCRRNLSSASKKVQILTFDQSSKHSISQFSSNQRMVFSGRKDKSVNELIIILNGGQID